MDQTTGTFRPTNGPYLWSAPTVRTGTVGTLQCLEPLPVGVNMMSLMEFKGLLFKDGDWLKCDCIVWMRMSQVSRFRNGTRQWIQMLFGTDPTTKTPKPQDPKRTSLGQKRPPQPRQQNTTRIQILWRGRQKERGNKVQQSGTCGPPRTQKNTSY